MQSTGYFVEDVSGTKRSGTSIVLLMLVSILGSFSSPANASDVVLTDPSEVVQSATYNDRMISMDADSGGNVH